MKTLVIEGYLTQDKLYRVLKEIFPSARSEVPVEQRQLLRWDVMFEYKGKTFVVEYDGDSHYRDYNVQKRDSFKLNCAVKDKFKLVRIPYFVQLTDESFWWLFSVDLNELGFTIEQDFPHGFIDKKVIYPVNFNERGTATFLEDLEYTMYKVPEIAHEIIQSLLVHPNKHEDYKVVDPDKVSCSQKKELESLCNYNKGSDLVRDDSTEVLIAQIHGEFDPEQEELSCPQCTIEALISYAVQNQNIINPNEEKIDESVLEAIKLIKFAYKQHTPTTEGNTTH